MINKTIILTGTLLLASVVSGQALALCDGSAPYTTIVTDTATLFGNKTICATGNGDQWHEYHAAGNILEKIGNGTATGVDPNMPVGSWNTTANTISYTYTGDAASPYNYIKVYSNGGNDVELCGTGSIRFTGTLSAGKVLSACP